MSKYASKIKYGKKAKESNGKSFKELDVGAVCFSAPTDFTITPIKNLQLECSTDALHWQVMSSTKPGKSNKGVLYCRGKGNTSLYTTNKSWTISGNNVSLTGNLENLLDYRKVKNKQLTYSQTAFSYMFQNCKALSSVVLTNIHSLSPYMFYGCTNLKKMFVPYDTEYIDTYALEGCSSDLVIQTEAPQKPSTWKFSDSIQVEYGKFQATKDGFTYIDHGDEAILVSYTGTLTELVVPSFIDGKEIVTIGEGAFSGCSTLEKLTVPFVGKSKFATGASSSTLFGYIFGSSSYDGSVKITQRYASSENINYYIPASLKSVTIAGGELFYGALSGCNILTSVTMPEKMTSIGNRAFYYCTSLTSVTIPASVTSIGEYAFYHCTSLASATIPDGVISIGDDAFESCSSLTSVTIPDSVISIGRAAFQSCGNLTSIIIPNEVTSIGNWAFARCSSLASVLIGNGVESIGSCAFEFCSSLSSVTFAEGSQCTSIGGAAFCYCSSLTELAIPSGVTSIGEEAFSSCHALMSITIPSGVTSISTSTFAVCSSLTSVMIPDGVTIIGDKAFKECKLLAKIKIPSSVKRIGEYAFEKCWSLSSVVIPDSVTNIGKYAFYDCQKLASVFIPNSVISTGASVFFNCSRLTVYCEAPEKPEGWDTSWRPSGSTVWGIIEGGITENDFLWIEQSDGITIIGYHGNTTSLAVPATINGNNVIGINDSTFKNCSSLVEIEIPSSVINIEGGAFEGCDSLASVHITDLAAWCGINFESTSANPLSIAENLYLNGALITNLVIPDGVTSIRKNAFYGYTALASVTIPSSVTSIEGYAFYRCSVLTSITIPDSVTNIGEYAFYGCSSLESITLPFVGASKDGTSKTHFGYIFGASSSSSNNSYVPTSLKTVVITGNASIGGSAFKGCSSLTSVTIFDSVTSIGSAAFEDCTSLTSVIIFNGVTSIGNRAFYRCSLLTSITIPESVTSIGEEAFQNCSSLTSITIPASVTSIGDSAFQNCYSLTIYCEAASKPSEWNSSWNYSNCPVVWDCKNNEIAGDGFVYAVVDGFRYALKDGVATVARQPSNITTADIPATVTHKETTHPVSSVGKYAFKDCSLLISVTIPADVTSISHNAFNGCTSLTSIAVDGNNTTYQSIDGDLYTKDGKMLVRYAPGKTATSFVIPADVTNIGDQAFYDCIDLTSIDIPASVIGIGSLAFFGCDNLTSVYITDLAAWCKISFDGSSANPLSIAEILYLNGTLVTDLIIPADITSIGKNAFYGCTSLTSVTIPASVTNIGNYAFGGCSSLTSATFAEGSQCTSIGNSAFRDCTSLTSIIIPEGVTTIGDNAFYGCTSLTSVTIPASMTSIGSEAFRSCSSLPSVTIPNGVTTIKNWAFGGCTLLTIYCEVATQPSGWNSSWNSSNRPVVWDCKNVTE